MPFVFAQAPHCVLTQQFLFERRRGEKCLANIWIGEAEVALAFFTPSFFRGLGVVQVVGVLWVVVLLLPKENCLFALLLAQIS